MTGYRSRTVLSDYAKEHRVIFLRAPWWMRMRRWIRAKTFGLF